MNQAEMALVQSTHRGDQANGAMIFAPKSARDRHHSLATIDDFHLLVNRKS